MTAPRQAVAELERRFGRAGTQVLSRLRHARAIRGEVTTVDVSQIAEELRLPRASVAGAASFFADLRPGPPKSEHVRVCAGTACFAATAGRHLEEAGSAEPVYCLGYCYGGPAALRGNEPRAGRDLADQLAGRAPAQDPPIPVACVAREAVVLAGLEGRGPEPWRAWAEVLRSGDRIRVAAEVERSGIRGRGGAGFPAARKWAAAAAAGSDGPRYVVANGDEGDPGSFADRYLMEHDPHRVLEGLALAGLAIGASAGYAYVRSEYPRAVAAMRFAVGEARAAGHIGAGAEGTEVNFDIDVVEGAGSYVAGEETSLINSMEGRRGGVMARPPYPVEHGLYARPTAVNNVETLSAVPWIVDRGGERYAALGTPGEPGTKLVSLNERFARPGLYEVDLGVTLRWVCEELGGGLRDGRRLRSLQVGGPLGGFLGPDDLDVPLTTGALAEAGVALGHAGLVAFDDEVPAEAILRHTWSFAASESCGTCAPCRIGSRRGLEVAAEIESQGASPERLAGHDDVAETMRPSLCGFGQSVPGAVRSLVRVYARELGAT
jgi:NADH:ubiquinone oxidoreductase subunit F (NADH-binding)/NADH:ubiquinone oxidoreductase subunit E